MTSKWPTEQLQVVKRNASLPQETELPTSSSSTRADEDIKIDPSPKGSDKTGDIHLGYQLDMDDYTSEGFI